MSATAVIYARISQDRDGTSVKVENQLKDCRALARKLGLSVVEVYTDNDISATNGSVRPNFERMLVARPEAIISWHQDRLLRLTSDLEKVIALDIPIYTATAGTLDLTTPAGRAVARTIAAWSTYEGEQKAARMRTADLHRAENGHWQFSRRPYGYERVGQGTARRIEIVPAEAEIVREGYRRYLAGDSYYALAEDWNARGIPTFEGPWSMSRVRSMLRNERYAGLITYNGERVETTSIQWEPLIDRATWDAYVRMRDGRKRAGSWSTHTKHLLSGLIFCGVCGGRMTARPDRGRYVLSCTTNWCTSRGMLDVERAVVGVVLARLADPMIVARLREAPDLKPIETELGDLRQRRDDLADMVADGLLDRAKARERAQGLTDRIAVLSARLDTMRADSPLTDLALAESIPARWAELSFTMQRRVIQEIGIDVRVDKVRTGRRPFDPESIRIVWNA